MLLTIWYIFCSFCSLFQCIFYSFFENFCFSIFVYLNIEELSWKLTMNCIFCWFTFNWLFSDFDEDNLISSKDLVEIIQRITTVESSSDSLSDEEMQQLIDNVSIAEIYWNNYCQFCLVIFFSLLLLTWMGIGDIFIYVPLVDLKFELYLGKYEISGAN